MSLSLSTIGSPAKISYYQYISIDYSLVSERKRTYDAVSSFDGLRRVRDPVTRFPPVVM
jgi:hypothetical protein